MAARSAVVASDLPGYRAAAQGHAELVAPGDPKALAEQLEISLADAESATGRSSEPALDAAFAYASSRSMSAVAKQYLSAYEEAIERRRILGHS